MLRPGPLNLITDVPGLLVGHATSDSLPTGVTTLLTDDFLDGWRGCARRRTGAREINVLSPENTVGRLHAISLSAVRCSGWPRRWRGLLALEPRHRFASDRGGPAVPIVPGAVLFDLNADTRWEGELPIGIWDGPVSRRHPANSRLARSAPDAAPSRCRQRRCRISLARSRPGADRRRFGGHQSRRLGLYGGRTNLLGLALRDRRGIRRPQTESHAPAIDPVPEQSRLGTLGRLQPGSNTTLAVVAVPPSFPPANARAWPSWRKMVWRAPFGQFTRPLMATSSSPLPRVAP